MNPLRDEISLVITVPIVAVIVTIGVLLKRWLDGPKTADRAKDRARRMRTASILLPAPPAFLALAALVATSFMPESPDRALLVSGGLVCTSLAVVIHIYWRSRVKNAIAELLPSQTTGFWITLVILTILACGFSLNAPGGRLVHGIVPITYLLCSPLIIARVVTVLRRYRDAAVSRAFRLFRKGDPAGAIAELEHEIEMNGPTARRLDGLAHFHLLNGNFETAKGLCLKGLAIAPENRSLRWTYGIAMFRLGHLVEAEAALAEFARSKDNVWVDVILVRATLLIELGRLDEAERLLNRTEKFMKTAIVFRVKNTNIHSELAACRQRIIKARQSSKTSQLGDL